MRVHDRLSLFFLILFLAMPVWRCGAEPAAAPIPMLSLDPALLLKQAELLERGATQDKVRAFQLYCLAAAMGYDEAYYSLGWLYFNGRGVSRDPAVAMGWFYRADRVGDIQARNFVQRFPDIEPKSDQKCPLVEGEWNRPLMLSWVEVIGPVLDVDPMLVAAVIEQESAFNPKALSPKRAQGLMQLIPATARRLGVTDPWHPVQNMIGGTTYLRWLLQQFEGHVPLALAAYNAGEKAVQRYNGIPPYRETQNYVRRIMLNYGKKEHPLKDALPYLVLPESTE